MGSFIGFLLFIIGLILIAVGLAIPHGLWTTLWQTILGLVLSAAGLVMADQSETGCFTSVIGGLLALLGIVLLALGLASLVAGLSLFSTGGVIVRLIIGILFCVAGWLIIRRPGRDDFTSDPW